MTNPNQRPFALMGQSFDDHAAAKAWLADQPETVRQVSHASDDGRILQRPVIDPGAYVDPSAILIGGMIIRAGCYVGPQAIIRLDEKDDPAPLIIDRDTNIQDCAIVHSTSHKIGTRVIVAHQAIVHGGVVEDEVTIYIQAVVDGGGTVLGRGCFLHEGSYVGKGIRVPPGRYVAPGLHIVEQAAADDLPHVPAALRDIQAHVLELNARHCQAYRSL